jgi:hypothetical protein
MLNILFVWLVLQIYFKKGTFRTFFLTLVRRESGFASLQIFVKYQYLIIIQAQYKGKLKLICTHI